MKTATNRTMDFLGHIEMDLQKFADEVVEATEETSEPEVLTKEEFEKRLQSEADKRVAQALATQKAKLESEITARIEKERKEAERLAQLSAEEKAKELESQKQTELTEREKTLKRREMLLDTQDILADRGLPKGFADMLLGEDNDTTMSRINEFEKAFQQSIKEAVEARLKAGYKPSNGAGISEIEALEKQLADTSKLEERLMIKRKLDALKKQ